MSLADKFFTIIEDTFPVIITEEERRKIKSLGDFARFLAAKLEQPDAADIWLFQLRRTLSQRFGIEHKLVRPDCPLAALIPARGRRQQWQLLGNAFGLPLPGLERPLFVRLGIMLVMGAFFLAAYIMSFRDQESLMPLWLFAIGVFSPVITFSATIPLKKRFPARCTTVGDLLKLISKLNAGKAVTKTDQLDTDTIWAIFERILTEELKVKPDKIAPKARLSEVLAD